MPGVVRGDGRVPQERCVTCHNQPARIAEYENMLANAQAVDVTAVLGFWRCLLFVFACTTPSSSAATCRRP